MKEFSHQPLESLRSFCLTTYLILQKGKTGLLSKSRVQKIQEVT